jgi:hypothetical protein
MELWLNTSSQGTGEIKEFTKEILANKPKNSPDKWHKKVDVLQLMRMERGLIMPGKEIPFPILAVWTGPGLCRRWRR